MLHFLSFFPIFLFPFSFFLFFFYSYNFPSFSLFFILTIVRGTGIFQLSLRTPQLFAVNYCCIIRLIIPFTFQFVVISRLFLQNPHLINIFPSLCGQFQDGEINDHGKFRRNPLIQRHGLAVITLLDQIITELDNPPAFRQCVRIAVEKHMLIKTRGMKGNYFAVSIIHFQFQQNM